MHLVRRVESKDLGPFRRHGMTKEDVNLETKRFNEDLLKERGHGEY